MSDAYATERFMEAVHYFQELVTKLKEDIQGEYGKKIESVLIDIRAAITGLDGEELGRALVYKAYVTHWLFLSELRKKNVFELINQPVDKKLVDALSDARKGLQLLLSPEDIKWAEGTVKQLEEYMR